MKNSDQPALEEALATRLAALGHPARLRILRHLASRPACCCKDVVGRLDLAQSTVSQHLKILVEAGLVEFKPERPRSRYSVDRAALERFMREMADLLAECCTPHGETRVMTIGR